jgi:hypothetical protein
MNYTVRSSLRKPCIVEPYIPGWMPIQEMEYLHKMILTLAPQSCAEFGIFSGRSAYAIALALDKLCEVRSFIGIDIFHPIPLDVMKSSMKRFPCSIAMSYKKSIQNLDIRSCLDLTLERYPVLRKHLTTIEADSATVSLSDYEFDFVFIDADHSYESVRNDIATAKKHMPHGGIICFHDYTPIFPGVCSAVHEFLDEPSVVHVDTFHTILVARLLRS